MSVKPQLNIEPKVVFLGRILEDIQNGKLRVPNFQRQFVWRPEQMLALLDSIKSHYPIGSLLFWLADDELASFNRFGPHTLPEPANKNNYILDGHQRLSTLYGSLIKPTHEIGDSDWIWKIYYDLKNEKFIHQKRDPNPWDLPLHTLLRTIDVLNAGKQIQSRIPDKAKAETYINRAEILAQTFATYKLALIQIEGGGLSSALKIFSRINSSGTKISMDQMLTALTYNIREGFNLSEEIDDIQNSLTEYNFNDIDRTTITRSILAAAEKDMYDTDFEKFAKESEKELVKYVEKAKTCLIAAARFLYEELNVPGSFLLPYQMQLIFLAEFFRYCPEPASSHKKLLYQWFWCTSYTGWFASIHSATVRKGLWEIQKIAQNKQKTFNFITLNEPAVALPSKFNMRNARIRTYILFLNSLEPFSLKSKGKMDIKELFLSKGNKSLRYILHRRNETANRMISDSKTAKSEYNALININLDKQVLDSHGITHDALALLKQGDDDGFIQKRQETLMALEKTFMEERNVTPGSDYQSDYELDDTI